MKLNGFHHLTAITAHANTVYGLAFAPDGSRLASASYDRSIKVWALK